MASSNPLRKSSARSACSSISGPSVPSSRTVTLTTASYPLPPTSWRAALAASSTLAALLSTSRIGLPGPSAVARSGTSGLSGRLGRLLGALLAPALAISRRGGLGRRARPQHEGLLPDLDPVAGHPIEQDPGRDAQRDESQEQG